MKDLECSVHGSALVEKEVPIFYGMPTPDFDIFEIGSRFPHQVTSTVTERGSNTRVKLHSKMEALSMLARHLGMFVERVEHSGKVNIDTDIYQEMSLEEARDMLRALRSRPVLEGEGSVE